MYLQSSLCEKFPSFHHDTGAPLIIIQSIWVGWLFRSFRSIRLSLTEVVSVSLLGLYVNSIFYLNNRKGNKKVHQRKQTNDEKKMKWREKNMRKTRKIKFGTLSMFIFYILLQCTTLYFRFTCTLGNWHVGRRVFYVKYKMRCLWWFLWKKRERKNNTEKWNVLCWNSKALNFLCYVLVQVTQYNFQTFWSTIHH